MCCGGSEGCKSQSCWHRRETIRREKCVSTAVHNQARDPVCVSCGGIKGGSLCFVSRGSRQDGAGEEAKV